MSSINLSFAGGLSVNRLIWGGGTGPALSPLKAKSTSSVSFQRSEMGTVALVDSEIDFSDFRT